MSNILIGGAAGFLGSHLAEDLIKKGHTVIGVDNLLGGTRNNLPSGIIFYDGDCCNTDDMDFLIKKHNIDYVYSLQASPYEGLSVFSPAIVNKNTYQSTISLLSASINNKVKKFIFASSMARYGENIPPFTESMSTEPCDPYGMAKVFCEEQIKLLCNIHNIPWTIVVPHNIIGPKQKYDDPFRNVASIFINRMLQNKSPIIYGDGEQVRCFSFVQDCINCLSKVMNDNVNGEIINIGPDEEFITINELAKLIADKLNFKGEFIYVDKRPQEVKRATCSSDKARRLLDYKTKTSLSDGLDSMIEYIKKMGPKKFDYYLPLEIINEQIPKTWKERLI